ncbi:MAG: GumC family protein [Candidatus Zixiibacteriota bacterium]
MSVDSFKTGDIKNLLPIIKKRQWLIILPWVLVSVLVFGGTFLMTPEYESSTIIAIDPEVKLSTELQNLLGINRGYRGMESQYDQLRSIYNEIISTRYISQLSERLQLGEDPVLTETARQLAAAQPHISVEQAKLDLLQSSLMEKVIVTFAAGDQVRITAQSADPARARDIANTLGEIFISEKLKQELSSIRSSQDFSDIQLQRYENLLAEKTRARTELEKEYLKIQLDESVTSDSNRTEISSEIDRTNNTIADYQDHEREILRQIQAVSNLSVSNLKLDDSQAKTDLEAGLKQQLRSIGDLMIKYTWSDPQILNFKVRQNSQLNALEAENRKLVSEQYANVGDSVQTLLVSLFNTRSELDYLYSKASYLEAALNELMDKMNMIPEYQARMSQLDNEILTTTELRDRFKRQQESSSISQALLQDMSSSKYKVVEEAKLPLAPFKPNRMRIILMGVVLGLVVGGSAAVVAELFDTSFKKVADVETELGLKVMGVIPKIDSLKYFK